MIPAPMPPKFQERSSAVLGLVAAGFGLVATWACSMAAAGWAGHVDFEPYLLGAGALLCVAGAVAAALGRRLPAVLAATGGILLLILGSTGGLLALVFQTTVAGITGQGLYGPDFAPDQSVTTGLDFVAGVGGVACGLELTAIVALFARPRVVAVLGIVLVAIGAVPTAAYALAGRDSGQLALTCTTPASAQPSQPDSIDCTGRNLGGALSDLGLSFGGPFPDWPAVHPDVRTSYLCHADTVPCPDTARSDCGIAIPNDLAYGGRDCGALPAGEAFRIHIEGITRARPAQYRYSLQVDDIRQQRWLFGHLAVWEWAEPIVG